MPQCNTCNRNVGNFDIDLFSRECSKCRNVRARSKLEKKVNFEKSLPSRKPWFSSIGLIVLLVPLIGGTILGVESSRGSAFGGFAWFGIMTLWLIITPISIIFGAISLSLNEKPKGLAVTLTTLASTLLGLFALLFLAAALR